MLTTCSKLIGTPVISVQSGTPVGFVASLIVNPDNLKTIAFRLDGPLLKRTNANILDVKSIREYSRLGMVIDSADELIEKDDVISISKVLDLNFDLIGLKVETKKHHKLGRIVDYSVTAEDFIVQQIIVKRPAMKALIDPNLIISRKEIVEITDYKVIIKDEEKTLKKRAEKEDFIPNFVNPFRKSEQDFAPADAEEEKE